MTDSTPTPLAPKHLGQSSELPASPEAAVLDYVPNPRADELYLVRFAAPEFTSLCPVTGQPDFAILVIDYVPGAWLVESKSLKLYLFSYRDEGTFMETLTNRILDDLVEAASPLEMEVTGDFAARGGITIAVTATYKKG